MSAKDQIKQIVDYFKREPQLKDKTDGMAEGLMLGANLADEANELSKSVDDSFKRLQQEYTENGNGAQSTAELLVARDGEMVLEDRLKRDFGKTVQKNELLVNVADFGVIGDGITNDTLNFKRAVDYAIEHVATLFIPDYMNVVLDKLSTQGLRYLQANGTIICPEITIGYLSIKPDPSNYYVRRVYGSIKCVGMKNALTNVQRAEKVILFADGDNRDQYSIAYSIFNWGTIDEIELDSVGVESGWINENVFIGGRVNKITSKGNYPHNGNVWYKPQFDNAVIDIQKGHTNVFHDCRFEGNVVVTFGEGTHDNLFEKIYQPYAGALYTSGLYNSTVVDDGFNNKVFNILEQYQKRNTFYQVDASSSNYDVGIITPAGNNKLTAKAWSDIFNSGLVPFDDDFAIKFKADVAGFRCMFTLYDSSGNIINDAGDDVIYVNFAKGSDSVYTNTANSKDVVVVFRKKRNVRYIKFGVIAGSADVVFSALSLTVEAPITANIQMSYDPAYDLLRGRNIPTSGVFKVGDRIKNINPTGGNYEGWVCTVAGSPGTWKPYGLIQA